MGHVSDGRWLKPTNTLEECSLLRKREEAEMMTNRLYNNFGVVIVLYRLPATRVLKLFFFFNSSIFKVLRSCVIWNLASEWWVYKTTIRDELVTNGSLDIFGPCDLWDLCDEWCLLLQHPFSKVSGPSFLRPHHFQDSKGFGPQALPTGHDPNVPQKGLLFKLIFQLLQEAHNSARLEFVASLRWFLTHARWSQT